MLARRLDYRTPRGGTAKRNVTEDGFVPGTEGIVRDLDFPDGNRVRVERVLNGVGYRRTRPSIFVQNSGTMVMCSKVGVADYMP